MRFRSLLSASVLFTLSTLLAGTAWSNSVSPGSLIGISPWGSGWQNVFYETDATGAPPDNVSTNLPDQLNPNAPTGIVTGQTSSVDQIIPIPPFGSIHLEDSASVHFTGHAALGVLDLNATAKADAPGDQSSSSGSDKGSLFWWDSVKLVGLPGRTLQATLAIQSPSLSVSGDGQGDAKITQSIQTLSLNFDPQFSSPGVLCMGIGSSPPCPPGSGQQGLIQGMNGDKLEIIGELDWEESASACNPAQGCTSHGEWQASDTPSFHIVIDPITPDTSIESASGATYLPPVPEPSTLLMFGSGLLAIGGIVRRGLPF